ncbi:MAG: DUF2851 family protein [bacterium]|nr:DUF2851 family protein [Candidatus Colisoma equi]
MKPITERHVQAIWYDAALRPKHLTTRRGSEVRVVSPGEWNLEAGPDFRNAVLEVGKERRRIVGDVEVHLCPSDWDFHRHGVDPNYRNVVAHVTWGCGPVPGSLPSGAISIWLGRFVQSNTTFAPEQIDLMAYPYARLPSGMRPCEEKIGRDPDLARRLLAEAGRHRLRMKARRMSGRLCAVQSGRRQVFYEEVMTALGYKRNQAQFRHVAERVPIRELPTDANVARTMLLTAGGFEEWDRTGFRPHNTPEQRLANAASVFTETPTMEMAEAADFSSAACRTLVKAMCGEGYMGKGRAAAVLANVVVPFALAEERVSSIPDWLPPEDLSEPVRLTAFRMFGRDHNPAAFYSTNGLLIQGLLQIHRDYCLQVHPDCTECELVYEKGT